MTPIGVKNCSKSIFRGDHCPVFPCEECQNYNGEKKTTEEDAVALNGLLCAIEEVASICENTAELDDTHTHEEAMANSAALTEILLVCREIIKKHGTD